jgi:hypothetical protein
MNVMSRYEILVEAQDPACSHLESARTKDESVVLLWLESINICRAPLTPPTQQEKVRSQLLWIPVVLLSSHLRIA